MPEPQAWLLKINAPEPDNKAIYQNLDALNPDGTVKREVYNLACIPIEDETIFQNRTLGSCIAIQKAFQEGRLDDAEQEFIFNLGPSINFAMLACTVLQPVNNYLCSCDDESKRLLRKYVSQLKAARKFRVHERRRGTSERNRDLTHAEFEDAVRVLARGLGRPPFRGEIADETGETLKAVAKKLSAVGLRWIPAKGRGPAKLCPRLKCVDLAK